MILWKKEDYLLIIKLGVQNKLKTIFKIKVDDYLDYINLFTIRKRVYYYMFIINLMSSC